MPWRSGPPGCGLQIAAEPHTFRSVGFLLFGYPAQGKEKGNQPSRRSVCAFPGSFSAAAQ